MIHGKLINMVDNSKNALSFPNIILMQWIYIEIFDTLPCEVEFVNPVDRVPDASVVWKMAVDVAVAATRLTGPELTV